MSPRAEALAYRIWAYATPREWDCTYLELAEALGESVHRIGAICRHKGWKSRLRASQGSIETHKFSAAGRGGWTGLVPDSRLDELVGHA